MPDMSGIDFLARILKMYPMIRRILISGKMDVNIVMESIDISKVHKILVKPFNTTKIRREINYQLNIYKTKSNYKQQLDGLEKQITKPFDLFELQIQELISIFEPIWMDKNKSNYLVKLIDGINTIIDYSLRFIDLYLEDSIKFKNALQFIKQNLEELNFIANQYKQFNLQMYLLILHIYCALIEEEYDEAQNYFYQYNILSRSILSDFGKLIREINEPLFLILEDKFDVDTLINTRKVEEFPHKIKELLEFDTNVLINLDENVENIQQFNQNNQVKFYGIMILKNESVIFMNSKLSNTDTAQLYSFVNILQNLSSELLNKGVERQTILFKGGLIMIHIFDTIKYGLLMSENTFENRLIFQKFILETLDIIKTIPIHSAYNEDDIKYIYKLANQYFDS